MRSASARVLSSCLVAAAASFFLAGCATSIAMSYRPTAAAVPLDLETKPVVFLERVEDRSGGASPGTFGGKYTIPPESALRSALLMELERLGIGLAEKRGLADALLQAAWVRGFIRVDSMGFVADIAIALTLRSPEGAVVWESTILASSPRHGSIRGNDGWSGIFSEALAAAMNQIGPLWDSQRVFAKLPDRGAQTIAAKTPKPRGEGVQAVVHSDVDKPNYRLTESPNNFALVVGIDKYKDLPEARFGRRDADAVRAHLLALGFPERNVILLGGENATRSGLQKYLDEWLPRNVNAESTVFFYYSGHGAPDVKTGEAFLVPWDGDPQFLQTTAYPVKQIYSALGQLKAKRVLVALDACFSGAGGRSVLAHGVRPLVTKVEAIPSGLGKITLFAAASGDEITGSLDEQGHGMFTYYFLKGLSGSATVKGVFDSLKPMVQDGARRQNREQTPVLVSEHPDQRLIGP